MKVQLKGITGPQNFDPLPPGVYPCSVAAVEDSYDGSQISLEFVVLGPDQYCGRKLWDRLFATPKALPRLRHAAEALGFDVDGEVELTPESLCGRLVMLKVEEEFYQGKKKNKVAYHGYAPVPHDRAAGYEALASQIRRNREQAQARPAAMPPQAQQPQTPNSELPF